MASFDPAKDALPLDKSAWCICGRQKLARDCCLRTGRFLPHTAAPRLPRRSVLFRQKGCYAAATGQCTSGLSREHSISEGVLRAINRNKGVIGVEDPKSGSSAGTRGLQALASRVLCARHNSALSGLDRAMARFSDTLLNHADVLTSPRKEAGQHYVAGLLGDDIERWMLKTLSAKIASGHMKRPMTILRGSAGSRRISWLAPPAWLDSVFGAKSLPWPLGLYVRTGPTGQRAIPRRAAKFGVLWSSTLGARHADVAGCSFELPFAQLFLLLGSPALLAQLGPSDARWYYRPSDVRIVEGNRYVAAILAWRQPPKRQMGVVSRLVTVAGNARGPFSP